MRSLVRGKANGFVRADYAQIAALCVRSLAREPATLREITIVNRGDERLADIRSALRKLDEIIFCSSWRGEIAQCQRIGAARARTRAHRAAWRLAYVTSLFASAVEELPEEHSGGSFFFIMRNF